MAIIKTSFGSGGANLAPGGAAGDPTLATALRDVADDLAAVNNKAAALQITAADVAAVAAAVPTQTAIADVSEHYGVVQGLNTVAPTTPSSQAVDPGGFTDWNVNVEAGTVIVNDVGKYTALATDLNISTGAKILEIGEAMYAWLLEVEAGGTITRTPMLGVAAALGAETIPNDAAITAAVGHARWTKLALCHASRTADAVVVTTQDPSYKTPWGGAGSDLLNDIKARYNIAVTALIELRTLLGTTKTLTSELKADMNTMTNALDAVVLKTVKG